MLMKLLTGMEPMRRFGHGNAPVIGMVALSSCNGSRPGSVTAEEAVGIANRQFLAGDAPPLDLRRFRVRVRDQGGSWRVAHIREGTGGLFITDVDKRTGK